MQMKTKQAKHWTHYTTQIFWAVVAVALLEHVYPTPWLQSPFGEAAWAFISFYIIKGWVEYKQIKSPRFYRRTQRWAERLKGKQLHLSDYTRYRLATIWRSVLIALAVGYVIDMSTPACEGALNCAVSIPTLIAQNMADLIWFAIRLAMGFAGFIGVQEMAARKDLMDVTLPHSIKTRFSDVYGQDSAVASVKEALDILDKPDQVEKLGGFMPTGILLFGVPGVGKSWIAEAAAGEAAKPFVSIDGTSFTSMWAGVPTRRVKLIFKKLRKLSVKFGGCIVFFDEIDVLGSRSGGFLNGLYNKFVQRHVPQEDRMNISSGGSGALQQILTEMSGMKKSRGFYNKLRVWFGFEPLPPQEYHILWIAATNLPEALDGAMTRPGRFDRKLKLGYPTLEGRITTIKGYLAKISSHTITDAEVRILAKENDRATGASIKAMVNEGLLSAVRDGRDYVTFKDLRDHMLQVMMGEVTGRMELEEDRWRTAVHEAAHAVMSHHERPEAPMQFVSVEKRDATGGFVRAIDDVDRYTLKSRLIADIKVCLASTWAERYYFEGNVSSGPSSDLQKATQIAESMWSKLAMGNTILVSDKIDGKDRREMQKWMDEIYSEVEEFLLAHKDQVELVAQLIDKEGTVAGAEVHELLERVA